MNFAQSVPFVCIESLVYRSNLGRILAKNQQPTSILHLLFTLKLVDVYIYFNSNQGLRYVLSYPGQRHNHNRANTETIRDSK